MKSIQYIVMVVLFLALSACTSMVSKNISDDGIPEEVVFPDKADAWNEEGIFPNVGSLHSIGPGVGKQTIYQLIGVPHFSERIGAREWDYIFNFRNNEDQSVTQCQYKIIFDVDRLAQSFYWLPRDCGKDFFQSDTPDNY
ncbi:MAG: cell envelope protein SmpA [Deltaproteobacteria bacterium]|nr:MAG: cell envelope protein SmpA [Deltaproteobacteria bacterium]